MGNENSNSEANTAVNAPEAAPVSIVSTPEDKPNVNQRLSSLLSKLNKSSLFVGKRKFVTVPIFALALVALVVVPVLIFSGLTTEETWFVDTSRDVTAIVNESGVDAALTELDRLIQQAEGNNVRIRDLYGIKTVVLINAERSDAAIITQREAILHTEDLETLESRLFELALMHERFGQLEEALMVYEEVRAVSAETHGDDVAFFAFYDQQIAALREQLGINEEEE